MNTLEYLEACKKQLRIESDYAVAKALNIRTSTISGYRARGGQMEDEIALRVAEILGKHPGIVILDMHRERASKTPEVRAVWNTVMEKFSTSFLNLLSGKAPRQLTL